MAIEKLKFRQPRRHSLIAAIILSLLAIDDSSVATPIESHDIRVIDGDTIRIYHKQPSVRLVGFNAPETRRAACTAERELCGKATRRVRELIRSAALDFEFIPCSCPAGTEGTASCNHGRRCGTLKANGRDVGAGLIEEGSAVPFVCGLTRWPKTPRPWCQ
jgi:endonuclease YncB( thermonuclease family)